MNQPNKTPLKHYEPSRSNNEINDFNVFARTLLTGFSEPELTKYLCYSSGINDSKQVKWPLCYILRITQSFPTISSAKAIIKCIKSFKFSKQFKLMLLIIMFIIFIMH